VSAAISAEFDICTNLVWTRQQALAQPPEASSKVTDLQTRRARVGPPDALRHGEFDVGYSNNKCLAFAPLTAAAGMVRSKVTKRPRFFTASASK
jgi:hypothetical protein